MAGTDRVLDAARQLFAFESLLPGQREAIDAVVAGRDTLAVLATGAGKSAIYAVAGYLRPGPTIVVSPLLALQRDQLLPLEASGLRAFALNSAVPVSERHAVLTALERGEADFVYLAPEQLGSVEVLDRLAAGRPGLFAVDEAHLVSQWGQDFRPDYLRIASAVEAIGRPPILALTATAAPPVREDIITRLAMRDPAVLVRGFDRPNIYLGVHSYFASDIDKLEALRADVVSAVREKGHGIVYAGTRHGVEGLAADWRDRGVRARAYHAGMKRQDRLAVEQAFHHDDLEVVVATVAFGMGVNKPNVRWVFHADASPSVDAYYQEIGRAGRDGDPAEAMLYYRPEDMRIPNMYASRAGPSADTLTAVAAATANGAVDLNALAGELRMSRARATAAVMVLARAGGVTLSTSGTIEVVGDLSHALHEAVEMVGRQREMERTRADTMVAYAEHLSCRRKFLLEYFGEPFPETCQNCDNDERATVQHREDVPYARGSRVRHPVFGAGEVVGYAGDRILITFDNAGYRRLDLGLVADGNLLERLD